MKHHISYFYNALLEYYPYPLHQAEWQTRWHNRPDWGLVSSVVTFDTMVCHSATCVLDQSSWHRWAVTASTACVARLGAVADWWHSWLMANALACLCWQWRVSGGHFENTLWLNLFSLYLINFMFHNMLDAACNILRVHYKSMKCDVSFSLGSVSALFRWGGHFCHVCVKHFSCLQQCKNYKNRSRFSRIMITSVLPRFLWFTV